MSAYSSAPASLNGSHADVRSQRRILHCVPHYGICRAFLRDLGGYLYESGYEQVLAVTDDKVSECWGEALESALEKFPRRHSTIVIPSGERSKNLETVALLHRQLLDLEADRHTAILSLGGGVVSDIVGLAAATFMRGLPLILMPSTLLAMVDAAIGGKNGVDLPEGKNLIGTIYLPQSVWSDLDLLSTLPPREWSNGLSEALKTAIIGDDELFNLLEALDYETLVTACHAEDATRRFQPECSGKYERIGDLVEEIVSRSAAVKGRIVCEDLREAGVRAKLNLGHTLGHGLEAASHYEGLSHGEAVALGVLAAVHIAESQGILRQPLEERLTAIYRRWRLPVRISASIGWTEVEQAIRRDKKRRGQKQTLILPAAIGDVRVVADADDSWLAEAFSYLREKLEK